MFTMLTMSFRNLKADIGNTAMLGGQMLIAMPGMRDERFQKTVQAVVDAGACPMQPTTVIDLTGDEPLLVRMGGGDPALLGLQPHT